MSDFDNFVIGLLFAIAGFFITLGIKKLFNLGSKKNDSTSSTTDPSNDNSNTNVTTDDNVNNNVNTDTNNNVDNNVNSNTNSNITNNTTTGGDGNSSSSSTTNVNESKSSSSDVNITNDTESEVDVDHNVVVNESSSTSYEPFSSISSINNPRIYNRVRGVYSDEI